MKISAFALVGLEEAQTKVSSCNCVYKGENGQETLTRSAKRFALLLFLNKAS